MKFNSCVEVDTEHGLAYVHLTPEGTERKGIVHHTESRSTKSGMIVNLDYDEQGRIVGIELLGFELRTE